MEGLSGRIRLRYRGYSRHSGRRSGVRPVIQSFKKVINAIPASYTAGFQNVVFAAGVDSVAAGQTSNTDNQVPTGSMIKGVTVQFAAVNLTAVANFVNLTLQYNLASQAFVDPMAVGGNHKRNQVLFQKCIAAGDNQNVNFSKYFKIPRQFQRIREGMEWSFTWSNDATISATVQIIYKFYR